MLNFLKELLIGIKSFFTFEYDISKTIQDLNERITTMSLNLDALIAEVERATAVDESAVILLQKLTSELADVSAKLAATPVNEPVDTSGLDELVSKLKASTDSLAAAVVANTPAAPAPAPVVEEVPVDTSVPVDTPSDVSVPTDQPTE